jgi:hypothetical protein
MRLRFTSTTGGRGAPMRGRLSMPAGSLGGAAADRGGVLCAARGRPRAAATRGRCGGRARQGVATAVDPDQLERLEPDLERALADGPLEQLVDLLPVAPIARRRDLEPSPDLIEVDAHGPPPSPPTLGDVGLLDED